MATHPAVVIRRAVPADVPAITGIYNEAILTTTATFDTEPKTEADRAQWLEAHDERHPVLVAEVEGKVVGWSSLTRWSDRSAYNDTAETSFYVHSAHRGRGVGRSLKEAIIAEARRLKFHTIIARVADGSAESAHLNKSVGFAYVGTLKEVGRKFGRVIDVHIFQKLLDGAEAGVTGEEPRAGAVAITPFVDGAHRDQVVGMWRSVFGYENTHNDPNLAIDKKVGVGDGLFFVALVGVEVVGTIMAGYDGHRGWLYSLAVAPAHRRAGIGRELVVHAERALAQRGCVKINLQILEDNAGVARFYEAQGFVVEKRISMGKRLMG